jgi:hypothetical protein
VVANSLPLLVLTKVMLFVEGVPSSVLLAGVLRHGRRAVAASPLVCFMTARWFGACGPRSPACRGKPLLQAR